YFVSSGIVALGDGGLVLFSGLEPQKNAGVVVLDDGGHVFVLRSCATKKEFGWNKGGKVGNINDLISLSFEYFVRAGVVALGDGGHVLVLRSCATKRMWAV
ncbi:hypothetical protein TNCV_1808581, partial [Trichonephila clavipes]